MVLVPKGQAQIGCNPMVGSCPGNDYPIHTVDLAGFLVDIYEVTERQYSKCIEAGDCNNNGVSPSDLPVANVSKTDAETYCTFAGKRLLTSDEWEKAARGGIYLDAEGTVPNPFPEGIFPWGIMPTPDCENDFANFDMCVGNIVVVDSYPNGRSPYGVYNMSGNVGEITLNAGVTLRKKRGGTVTMLTT
jgi:formylglycine-generating enzyme required for sulfatase activity